jgi:hypothetical protein
MKFLIDTNIFIPLEPTSHSEIESGTLTAAQFNRLTIESGHQVYVHPVTLLDIKQDQDQNRRKMREILFEKYPKLPDPPEVFSDLSNILGNPSPYTNDWIDNHLIAALASNAVDLLVTEDRKIHKKAQRLDLQERVTTVIDAISILQNLFDRSPIPPPAVKETKAHTLDENDPIFDSFRSDYPGFNDWLNRCKLDHRHTWVIEGNNKHLAAVCIIKPEKDVLSLSGKVLKICSFKVSENHGGNRFGELLLKTIFAYVEKNKYNWIYVTVFERHSNLLGLLTDFGFKNIGISKLGENILAKPLIFSEDDLNKMSPLDFNISFGPSAIKFMDVPAFIVPIQPRYHRILFPEMEKQFELIPGLYPYGNAIRKAYLSNSIIRKIEPGSTLLFYRSEDLQSIAVLGVVEGTLVSSSPVEIARYVGKRTVYMFKEIETMCKKPVLAILFRQARILNNPIPFKELVKNDIIKKAPQSIATIPKEAFQWLQSRINK